MYAVSCVVLPQQPLQTCFEFARYLYPFSVHVVTYKLYHQLHALILLSHLHLKPHVKKACDT
jgi:hypothetical protein